MTIDYYTPDDVAARLQVSRQVVYNWINDGRLRAVKAGRTLRIPHAALEAFLQPVHAGDVSAGNVEPEPGYHIDRFSAAAQAAFAEANSVVRSHQHTHLDVEHLLCALVQQPGGIAQQALQHLGVEADQVAQQLSQALANLPGDPGFRHATSVLAVTARIPRLLARAEEVASQLPDLQIDASHLLQAICEEADSVSAQILHSLGITPQRLQAGLAALRATAHAPDTRSDWEQRVEQQLTRIEARLAKISSILVQQA